MSITLPISRLINVNVTLTVQAAQAQSLSNLLILGSSSVIDVVSRMRSYASIAAVAADFGNSAPEYLAAVLWFEQNPQPTNLNIGRWAKTATPGQLLGGPLTVAQQLIATWNAIANGGFTIQIDGGAAQHVNGLNFSAAANLNGVAAVIDAAMANADCVWNSVYSRFEITSHTTGAASTVSYVTVAVGGGVTDISALLVMTQSPTSGVIQANGIVAESALTAVTLFDNEFGMAWFGLTVLGASDADHLQIAPYIEGAQTKHYYGVTTQEAGAISSASTTDIAYLLSQAGYNFTGVQYSSSNPYAVVSMLGRILTTDYTGNNTVITLMYKQEPGIVPENLNATQIAALEAKNANVFVAYNNNTAIVERGVSSSGQFVDSVIGSAALAIDIQTALFNVLYTSPTKVPQTDAGTHILTTAIAQVCAQYAANGLLAPGVWNGSGFGELAQGQFIPKGYYIFAPSVSTQTAAQRASRVSVPIQIAAKLAGAVQTVNVAITVNS